MISNEDVDFVCDFVYNIHTKRAYRYALLPLVGLPLTRKTLQGYIGEWRGRSQSTINVRRAALVHFVEKIAMHREIQHGIMDGVFYPEGSPPEQRGKIKEGDVARLFAAAKTLEEKLLLAVLYDSGLRMNDLTKLRFSDLMAESFILTVKGHRTMEVYPTPALRTLAAGLMDQEELDAEAYVFRTDSGGQSYYQKLYRTLRKITRRAGVNVTAHNFRHTFITRIAAQSDIVMAKELAGHASIRTTMGYVHPSRKSLMDAALAGEGAASYV